jgi:NAD(P)-dependent dehydrogenase (short-subunit alcohol dehydrogenase family)
MLKRTALILGGTSGVGLATARQLQAAGTAVHVAGRSTRRLDEVATSDPALIGHQVDANDATAVRALAQQLDTIDYLITTVSGSDGPGPIADLDLTMLRRAFEAKFWGHITSIQAVLPHLATSGSITLLGAVTARAGMPGTAGIAAINGAVEALVKPLATELAPIRVNAVSPGFIDTPWWNAMPDEARRDYFARAAASLPTGRIATAEEVAQAVVLAATNPSTTGTVIECDGGARLVSIG